MKRNEEWELDQNREGEKIQRSLEKEKETPTIKKLMMMNSQELISSSMKICVYVFIYVVTGETYSVVKMKSKICSDIIIRNHYD